MICFITGSSGFIGSNLIEFLKKRGTEFYKIDRAALHERKFPKLTGSVIHLAGKAHDLKGAALDEEYYKINTDLTKVLFDEFLRSDAEVFIFLSTIKVLPDNSEYPLDESCEPNSDSAYGKSKRLAEEYILSKQVDLKKRVYILRPCIVYGKGHRGNLELLYSFVKYTLPWPLGAFQNCRSFCSVDNLTFVINELIQNSEISSGIYHIADDDCISTNDLIKLIGDSRNKKIPVLRLNGDLIKKFAKIGDYFHLPFNSDRLEKLIAPLKVNNDKIKVAIGKPLPVKLREGLYRMFVELGNGII